MSPASDLYVSAFFAALFLGGLVSVAISIARRNWAATFLFAFTAWLTFFDARKAFHNPLNTDSYYEPGVHAGMGVMIGSGLLFLCTFFCLIMLALYWARRRRSASR